MANHQPDASEIILDQPGTYAVSNTLMIKADMIITGRTDDPGRYVIQPREGKSARVIDISEAHDVTLRNLTIQGGETSGDGGGIEVETAGASLTLTHTHIQDNRADGDGGGVALGQGVGLTITDSDFQENSAGSAGGALYFAADVEDAQVTIAGTTFSDNQAVGDGGAVLVESTNLLPSIDLTVTRTNFLGNASGYDGGGLWASDVTTVRADRLIARGNTAVQDAGAFGNSDVSVDEGSFTFTNSYVYGNQVTGPGKSEVPDGGGICFDFMTPGGTGDVTAVVTGNYLVNNAVAGAGGGMFLRDRAPQSSFTATFSGNHVARNQASESNIMTDESGAGGGLYLWASAQSNMVTLRGNQFRSNSAESDGGGVYVRLDSGTADFRESSVVGNQAGHDGGGVYVAGNTDTGAPGGDVNLTDARLQNNTACNDGGGLYVDATGAAYLVRDTISGNTAGDAGGGIFNDGGYVSLMDTTVTDNMAPNGPNMDGDFVDLGGNTIG